MNLDELKLQVEKDLKVDDEKLDIESFKNQEFTLDPNIALEHFNY